MNTLYEVVDCSDPRRQGADGSVAAAAPSPAGAALSNTAPANSIPTLASVLLTGIDSLYVSYRGSLNDRWDQRLAECKQAAQSDKLEELLQAQVEIAGHLFVVLIVAAVPSPM